MFIKESCLLICRQTLVNFKGNAGEETMTKLSVANCQLEPNSRGENFLPAGHTLSFSGEYSFTTGKQTGNH